MNDIKIIYFGGLPIKVRTTVLSALGLSAGQELKADELKYVTFINCIHGLAATEARSKEVNYE